jgi:hypothetical protein
MSKDFHAAAVRWPGRVDTTIPDADARIRFGTCRFRRVANEDIHSILFPDGYWHSLEAEGRPTIDAAVSYMAKPKFKGQQNIFCHNEQHRDMPA